MKKLIILDEHDYDPSLPEMRRTAVRGIIFSGERLLLIRSAGCEVKFPGGGAEDGESDVQTLIRETLEETGCHIVPESVEPFGEVEEKRMTVEGGAIWHQFSRYYFCRTTGEPEDCRYSDSEKELGFRPVLLTLDEAIEHNEALLTTENNPAWNEREYRVLLLLRERQAGFDT